MKIKIKCEGLGSPYPTKKGGFIRKFIAIDAANEKVVVTVYSPNESDLNQSGPHERMVDCDDFCFALKA
jgi:hypothetical protein